MTGDRETLGLAAAPPRTLTFACESCGAPPGLTIFLPNGIGGGRRVCRTCLAAVDALRARQTA